MRLNEFSLSLRTTDGLNETTRRAEISAGSPVFRLRAKALPLLAHGDHARRSAYSSGAVVAYTIVVG